MAKKYVGEIWKVVKFEAHLKMDGRMEVSNLGRIRTFNSASDGNILNGSMVNGYKIIRLKFYKKRDRKSQVKFDEMQQQVFRVARKVNALIAKKAGKKEIKAAEEQLIRMRQSLTKKFLASAKERTLHYHSLIHRLVADYFLKKSSPKKTIVGHLDFDRLNNKASNLKWMTPEENYEHQQHSPYVINEKLGRRHNKPGTKKSYKLTTEKVRQMKKLFNENAPMKDLVKKFKVTHTQILRIKRGYNWKDVKAAK